MDLNEHVWLLVEDVVEKIREADKKDIVKGKSVVPIITAFSYCVRCDRLTVCIAPLLVDMDDIRALFPLLTAETLKKTEKCRGCGRPTFPIGYAYSYEAWTLKCKGKDKEEAELYRRTVGTIRNHPERIEAYVMSVATVIGKKIIMEQIIRAKNRTTLRMMKMPGKTQFEGRFVLPLPKVNLNEAFEKG